MRGRPIAQLKMNGQSHTDHARCAVQVRHIDHVQLAMPAGREDEARAFYRDVLGIPEVAKPRIFLDAAGAGLRAAY